MGKPSAPAAPDYAAAAKEQGTANVNSSIASNFLNQVNQVGPNGSLKYSYDTANGYTLPDGTRIPSVTATTELSPEQRKLLDQNNSMAISLNDLAAKGIGYVDDASSNPIDQSSLPSLAGGLGRTQFKDSTGPEDYAAQRDDITNAMMERLRPQIDRDRASLENKMANQGITQGSEAWGTGQDQFQKGVNDQRIAALLAGDQEQQQLWNKSQQDLQNFNTAQEANFNQGLTSGQFSNQARQQAIQEADYFKNQPLNMLNALRSGNQVSMPTFGNVSGGAQIQPAPVYSAARDSYDAAMQQYQAKLQASSGLWGGLSNLAGSAILAI